MGALYYKVGLTNNYGTSVKTINRLYIWRNESLPIDGGFITYYASRTPPGDVQTEEVRTFVDDAASYIITPHVTFRHKYEDGAEICMARAILALQEAGMNV